jgi:hypothetical protein
MMNGRDAPWTRLLPASPKARPDPALNEQAQEFTSVMMVEGGLLRSTFSGSAARRMT